MGRVVEISSKSIITITRYLLGTGLPVGLLTQLMNHIVLNGFTSEGLTSYTFM